MIKQLTHCLHISADAKNPLLFKKGVAVGQGSNIKYQNSILTTPPFGHPFWIQKGSYLLAARLCHNHYLKR